MKNVYKKIKKNVRVFFDYLFQKGLKKDETKNM